MEILLDFKFTICFSHSSEIQKLQNYIKIHCLVENALKIKKTCLRKYTLNKISQNAEIYKNVFIKIQ